MKFRQEAFQVLRMMLRPTSHLLLWMTVLRLWLFFALDFELLGFHRDLAQALFAGFRFDLLILGFVWIPIVVGTWLCAIWWNPRRLALIWKLTFALLILAIFDLSWLDLFWTATHQSRINSQFFNSDLKTVVIEGWLTLGSLRSLFYLVLLASSTFAMILSLNWKERWKVVGEKKAAGERAAEPLRQRVESPPAKFFFQLIGSFLLVALAARGTWTAHHLNMEHSQVSEEPKINQLVLNPAWNITK